MNKPQRNPDIVWRVEKRRQAEVLKALEEGQDIDDSGTVILLQAGMMHQLNLVGGLIWQQCDGQQTLAAIAKELAREFSVEQTEVESDVAEFVADLAERGWLING
ncbi:MAG: pyrroloquinoline quinone biosynthesis peptide chaperone PqqD [Desulfuromonadales bacterium]|nr:pyrroloquinoline quinone biosynthesis peptide chaperone PqqD [Desulfuromonadales bacterium]